MTDDTRRLAVSVIAGDLVLGVQTPEERAEIEQRFAGDPDFSAEVAAWQYRLAPLAHLVPDVAPSPALWPRVVAETVARLEAAGSRQLPASADPPAAEVPAPSGVVIGLEEAIAARTRLLQGRVNRWRWATGAATAIAAGLALFAVVGQNRFAAPVTGERFVGVVSASGETPPLIVAVDLARGELAVRSLQARPDPGKAFELWAVPPGAKPVSLGLVAGTDTRSIAKVANATWRDPSTLLAISVEPPGGSPTGQATGPIIYTGRLVKAD